MNFNSINDRINSENLLLKPIHESDREFIETMFLDNEIKKYYIVPKEAEQNYKRLVSYWLNDVKNAAGTCWIIYNRRKGLFTNNRRCGFIAFEFRDSLKNARISYAVLPNFRRKGIASEAIGMVLDKLKENGVETVEADIDRDNLNSEKAVEKFGFKADKSKGLVDPEMLRDGEIRFRALWEKQLIEVKSSQEYSAGRIPLNTNHDEMVSQINNLVQEINSKGQSANLMLRYFYLLGRVKFLEGNYEEAQEAFGQCNMITMNQGLPDLHETFYWFAKINEAKGENETAKMYYGFALENFNAHPDYITKREIELELNRFRKIL